MRTSLVVPCLLLASAAAALAQPRPFTVASLDEETATGGLHVIDGRGQRFVLEGGLAVRLAREEGVVTVTCEVEGANLRAGAVRARADEAMRVRVDGRDVRIPYGAPLDVVGRRDVPVPAVDPQYHVPHWLVQLADGTRVWLSSEKHAVSFEPVTRLLEKVEVTGRLVEDDDGTVHLDAGEHGQVELLGDLRDLLAGKPGHVVEGSGIVVRGAQRPALHLLTLIATTRRATFAHRQPSAGAERAHLGAHEDVQVVGPGRDGFVAVRWDGWPTPASAGAPPPSFVPAADLDLGKPTVTAAGVVRRARVGDEDRFTLVTPRGELLVDAGGNGQLDHRLLEGLVGRAVRVGGTVENAYHRRGELALRWIEGSVVRDIEGDEGAAGVPAGTRVRVTGVTTEHGERPSHDWTVVLPDGRRGALGFQNSDAILLGEPVAPGLAGAMAPGDGD